ncbi:F-box protein At2g26160-like [Telopea speciosissima]|uniref:F-box protein At2g26160-like n=1 Tax=Telopea speciosissima TaxID=54955 RepID=UPI001CC50A85|nr:F-box protein At2g26160-like [Telopea speciosissima]
MGNWSELCDDILGLIVDRFLAIEDIVRFGAVCRTWRSVSAEKWRFSIAYPWLMLAEKEDSDNRGFYSLATQMVYHLNLPKARGRRCWSSCGWLITFGFDWEIDLLNPFSGDKIQLPPQPKPENDFPTELCLHRIFLRKVILSSRPNKTTPCEDDEKCVVMAIITGCKTLSFLRLGDEVWTPIDSKGIDDVIYFNGQFYAIDATGKVWMVDISSPQPKMIEFAEPGDDINIYAYFYLVESAGELFMLARDLYEGEGDQLMRIHETDGFDVYKFNFDNRKWMEVKSLDNRALFVGANTSFAIFPSNHLQCEPNCIYYTDDYPQGLKEGGGNDMGVFRLETEEIDDHYVGPDILSRISTPLWICPFL